MENENFGDRMRRYRKQHRLTQKQLAELMHISNSHVSSLERNEKMPKASTARAFQTLLESEDWERFNIVKELSDEEFVAYMNLWQHMRRLGAQKEKEVMTAFLNILDLL